MGSHKSRRKISSSNYQISLLCGGHKVYEFQSPRFTGFKVVFFRIGPIVSNTNLNVSSDASKYVSS